MAGTNGNTKKQSTQPGKLTYFYLDGQLEPGGPNVPLLHKSLHINRGTDTITTWCYPLGKRVAYTYSETKKRREPAYSTQDVCKMLNRKRLTLELAILHGKIEEPQYTYGLNEHRRKFKYMWAEHNILEAHAYLSTVHVGRPRKDGMVTPMRLPTLRELRAMIRQEEILYVRDDDGEFRPVWRAQNFD